MILENPLNVVVWLANALAEFGKGLRRGDVVSTGSFKECFFVQPGDVISVSFTNLGRIQLMLG